MDRVRVSVKKTHNIRDAFCEAYNRTTNTIHANLFGFQERVATSDFLAQACVALAETAVLYWAPNALPTVVGMTKESQISMQSRASSQFELALFIPDELRHA